MRLFLLIVGNVWMLPNTVVSALYLGLFALFGQLSWGGRTRWALKLIVVPGSWLDQVMRDGRWAGWSSGTFIILSAEASSRETTIKHEERHTQQQLVFGPLQPISYFIISIGMWVFCRNLHSYLDNPYERDARRYAGQRVNIPRTMWADPDDRWSWW